MSQESVLETQSLEKWFGGVRAVAGVDFKMRRGELRCLIGPNGAGKSTFFKLVTGQLRASGGRIIFDGQEITGRAPHTIGRLGIGSPACSRVSVSGRICGLRRAFGIRRPVPESPSMR
jgi:branched-chain amino acid transport system ATP-binding protein